MLLRFHVSGRMVHFREVMVVCKGNGRSESELFASKHLGVLKNKRTIIYVDICSQFDYILYCRLFLTHVVRILMYIFLKYSFSNEMKGFC
jgi:hypothetical protein